MTDSTVKTTQLRRYVIAEGRLDAFVPWWNERLVPARLESGFTIEFGYAIPATNEFVWAVTAEGDADHFRAVEAAYLASDARAAAFEGTTPWTTSMIIELVDRVA